MEHRRFDVRFGTVIWGAFPGCGRMARRLVAAAVVRQV